MSANLDKSLDEIIGSSKKPIRKTNKKAPKKVSKQIVGGGRRGGSVAALRQRAAPVRAANVLDNACLLYTSRCV